MQEKRHENRERIRERMREQIRERMSMRFFQGETLGERCRDDEGAISLG